MNKKSATAQQAEQAVVEDTQAVIVTDVCAPADAQTQQAGAVPSHRSSAARFMADLLKPVATRIAAQAPKAHLWELITFLNAVDHGNAPAAHALAERMLEMTLAMSAVVITTTPAPVAADAPAETGQQLRTSAARFAADLLKPVATRIAARTPKAIAWELIKFYNALDHRNAVAATGRAHELYRLQIMLVDQPGNQTTDGPAPGATSDKVDGTDDLLPDF